jgi:hypothetical protein
MRIVKQVKPFWYLQLEGDERLDDLIQAIARASFETARPVGMGALEFESGDAWDDVKNKIGKVNPRAASGEMLLGMDYVAGRRCKTQLANGRKYVRFFPGAEREDEATGILLLAGRYLGELTSERRIRERAGPSAPDDGAPAVEKQLRAWLGNRTPLIMTVQTTFFQLFWSGHLELAEGGVFIFRAEAEGMYGGVQPSNFDVVRLKDSESKPTVLLEKFSRGVWQGRMAFFEAGSAGTLETFNDLPVPSTAVN